MNSFFKSQQVCNFCVPWLLSEYYQDLLATKSFSGVPKEVTFLESKVHHSSPGLTLSTTLDCKESDQGFSVRYTSIGIQAIVTFYQRHSQSPSFTST